MGPVLAALPVVPPIPLALFPGAVLDGLVLPWTPEAGGRTVDPPGWVLPLGDAADPVDGDADEAPVPPPLEPPPPEPPEDPCAQATPAIRHPASSAVEIVR